MLSLEELRRAVRLLDALLRRHRVQAIVQPDATSVEFSTWGGGSEERPGAKHHLVLACGRDDARVGLVEHAPPPCRRHPPSPSICGPTS